MHLCLFLHLVSLSLTGSVSLPPSSHVTIQSLSHSDSTTPWTAARQTSLSFTISPSYLPPPPPPIVSLFLGSSLSFSLCSSHLATTPSPSKHWPSDPRTFSGLSQGPDSLPAAWLGWSGRRGTDSCPSSRVQRAVSGYPAGRRAASARLRLRFPARFRHQHL